MSYMSNHKDGSGGAQKAGEQMASKQSPLQTYGGINDTEGTIEQIETIRETLAEMDEDPLTAINLDKEFKNTFQGVLEASPEKDINA